MKSARTLFAVGALMCGAGVISSPAFADHWHGYGYYNDYDYHHWHGYPQEEVVIVPEQPVIVQAPPPVILAPPPQTVFIRQTDRAVILGYISEYHHHHCPPGTVKQHHYCVIPQQVSYIIGQLVPGGLAVAPVAPELLTQLGPVPSGYYYAQTNTDVLLISRRTGRIADAVSLVVRR